MSSAEPNENRPLAPKQAMQRFELDRRVFLRHDEKRHALFIAQEEVLGMAASTLATQRAGFLDGKYGGVPPGLVRDVEALQIGEKVVRRGGHFPH